MQNPCKLKGNYEVTYSCKADPAKETKPSIAIYRKIEIAGPPFAVLCFEKKKDAEPARVIPWERIIGIHKKEEGGTPAAKAGAKPKTKSKSSG